jgi:hypothetical protein
VIVVIPSARSVSFDYLKPLIEAGCRFIVVDDSTGNITIDHPQFEVYNWNDQERLLGDLKIAIPRKNGACRDFGFYIAWKESDPGETIIALDDDCYVEEQDFAARVEATLGKGTRPVASGQGKHFNILNCYRNVEANIYPRGFPYSVRADYEPWTFDQKISGEVTFNLGIWREIFDVNAIDKLRGPRYCYPDAELIHESVVVPEGALVSVCSMNMQFRRELVPVVYQLLMHVEVMPGWVIDRYGDIWGGFILKALMDLKGEQMAVGAPMIRHLKEGSYERNIWQEHTCHLVNDEFIALVETAKEVIQPSDYLSMMAQFIEVLNQKYESCSTILKRYFDHQIPALTAWVKALS